MGQFDSEDLPTNLSDNEPFQRVVERAVSRRGFLKIGAGVGAVAFLGGLVSACGGSGSSGTDDDDTGTGNVGGNEPLLGFAAVVANGLHAVTVPEGYTAAVLAPWGSAMFADSAAWADDGSNSGAEQARQVGDNHDGMHFFAIGDGTSEGLLVMNHEYNERYLYATEAVAGADDALKSLNAHGISVLHIRKTDGRWDVVAGSSYNRRLTGNSLMQLTGPAANHTLVVTSADPEGQWVRGTLNNCGNGYTLWGTYLTCEENFNQYFGVNDDDETDRRDDAQKRYGLSYRKPDEVAVPRVPGSSRTGNKWEQYFPRFDYLAELHESNRFGWIVEIDPFDPLSVPKKRTALGRFKHENCAMTLSKDGHVVVYMGDDQAGDYIYKFVSDGKYDAVNMSANRNLLESGKLYVARFDAGTASGDMMGNGSWLLLDKIANPTLRDSSDFADQASVLINARLAADLLKATPMDRPEWVSVHPTTGEVYCTLTNNSGRTADKVDDANPRAENRYGQIVRWREAGGDAAALTFEWDLFVLAGNPIAYPDRTDLRSGSANVNADNTFNSPDGLAFDAAGRLWIQTDGNDSDAGAYAGQGNNQMLAADPATGEIRRFFTGPKGSEVTGITWSADMKTMFVNIQHPGAGAAAPHWPKSQWPDDVVGGGARPRSATVVITKNDGGVIGS